MAEFKDGGLWMKLAFLTMFIGFLLDLFGFAIGITPASSGSVGVMIVGYLSFLTAAFLIMALIFLDEAKDNKIAKICFIVFAFIAGMLKNT